jgi:hypothetical protein
MADKYNEEEFKFDGLWDVPSLCGIKVINKQENTIIIATELYDKNPGTSVTNFNTKLAALICQKKNLDPEKITFIEHTPDRGSHMDIYSETFDVVKMSYSDGKFSDPQWNRITKKAMDEMI